MCLEAPRPAQPCAEDTVLILYDTETTGLGRTDKVRIVELGEPPVHVFAPALGRFF